MLVDVVSPCRICQIILTFVVADGQLNVSWGDPLLFIIRAEREEELRKVETSVSKSASFLPGFSSQLQDFRHHVLDNGCLQVT